MRCFLSSPWIQIQIVNFLFLPVFFLGILGILGILSCAMLLVLRYMSRVYFNCIDIDDRGIDGSVDIMNHFMENSFLQ